MNNRGRLLTTLFVGALGLSAPFCAVVAQRTSIEDSERAAQRRRQLLEQQRDAAAKEAKAKDERAQRLSRLNSVNVDIPGLPFIRANTVVVTNRRVVFMYMEPEVTVALAKGDRTGYYVWRWNMTEGTSPFSLVLTADTAMRASNFGDIVKAARVRRCNSIFETQALNCKNPVEAFVTRQGQGFRVEVADSAIYESMKKARPRTLVGLTFAPLGRSVAATYNVLYVDPNVKADRQ